MKGTSGSRKRKSGPELPAQPVKKSKPRLDDSAPSSGPTQPGQAAAKHPVSESEGSSKSECMDEPCAKTRRRGFMDSSFSNPRKSKSKKSDKHKKHKSHKKSRKEDRRSKKESKKHGKKRRRSSSGSSSSDSSSDSSFSSSVFRGTSSDPYGKSWTSMRARVAKYPGQMAVYMLQGFADQVGRDGVKGDWSRRDTPPCAQAYYNRVITSTGAGGIPVTQKRDRREVETLPVAGQVCVGRVPGDCPGPVFGGALFVGGFSVLCRPVLAGARWFLLRRRSFFALWLLSVLFVGVRLGLVPFLRENCLMAWPAGSLKQQTSPLIV